MKAETTKTTINIDQPYTLTYSTHITSLQCLLILKPQEKIQSSLWLRFPKKSYAISESSNRFSPELSLSMHEQNMQEASKWATLHCCWNSVVSCFLQHRAHPPTGRGCISFLPANTVSRREAIEKGLLVYARHLKLHLMSHPADSLHCYWLHAQESLVVVQTYGLQTWICYYHLWFTASATKGGGFAAT